jgi:hypothetical protein
VKPTHVKKQPSTDPIVILHPFNMDKLKINTYDYVNLKNTVENKDKSKRLEMSAQAISTDDKMFSKMSKGDEDKYPNDRDTLGKREIAVDQTCREALMLKVKDACEVTLPTTDRKYSTREKLLSRLDYQKAVVRVQKNDAYFERKTPVVCLCEEILKSINAEYGENIEVEYMDKRTIVKCSKLTITMKDFHDHVLNPNPDAKKEQYFQYLEDYGIKSEFSQPDMIHPISMDEQARESLGVEELDPVKIRRDFKWQLLKTVNKLGRVSAPLAIPVLIGFAGLPNNEPSKYIDVAGIILFALWLIWSVLTSSTYSSSNGND